MTIATNMKKGKADLIPSEEEDVPKEDIYNMGTTKWRVMRRENSYRLREQTYKGGGKLF
jgi:hypothetical protein